MTKTKTKTTTTVNFLLLLMLFFLLLGNNISKAQQQEQQQEQLQQQFTCPLSLLIPFHDGRQIASTLLDDNDNDDASSGSGSIITQEEHRRDGLTLLAIALMAIEDFNNRSSTLVPDVSNYKQCSLEFPTPTIFDTGRNVNNITNHQDVWFYDNDTTNSSSSSQHQHQHPCAIIGPKDNLVAEQVANILQGTIVPAISYGATATKLANDPYKYHNMVLGNIHWDDTIQVLLQYLKANNHHGVAILYEAGNNLDYEDYIQTFENANSEVGLYIMIQLISQRNNKGQLISRLSQIQQTHGINTIVVALDRDDNIQDIANIANDLGMLSEDYTWIFMDTFVSPQYIEKLLTSSSTTTSPSVIKLMKRLLLFQLLDGLVPFNIGNNINSTTSTTTSTNNNNKLEQLINNSTILHHDFIPREWIERGTSTIKDIMNQLLNQSFGFLGGDDESFFIDDEFFESNIPAYGSSFIYDAIMTIGMTACSGQSIVDGASFDGATAATAYQFLSSDGANRSLDVTSHVFGIFALEEEEEQQQQSGGDDEVFAPMKVVLVDTNYNGGWTQLASDDDDTTDDNNFYLSTASAAIGMTLASIGIIFCLISFGFIYYYRKDRIVSVSQPEFIYMICFGASLLSASIYFMSFDDSTLGVDILDAFCVIQVWFSRIGLLIVYSALFSKLWRVQRVSQFRRGQKIEVKHVLGPFAVLVCICLILMTVWSIVNPPHWVRLDVDHKFVKEEGSVGYCNESVGFSLAIDIIVIIAVALSLWMSNKTKHLPEDISDSSRVHQTLIAHLVLLMIGVVLMVFFGFFPSTNLLYLIRSISLFLTTISSVAFIVVPKMYYVRRKALTGELPPGLQRGRVKITGLTAPGPIAVPNKYSTSRFTVNQAHSPSASVTLGSAPSMTLRVDSGLPSTASTAVSNFSTRRFGLTSSINATSFRTLDSGNKATSFRGLDSAVSGSERASGNDFNSSFVSGMDYSDRTSNDLNASARSLNLNASTRSLLALSSPTSSDTHSPAASIDQAGQITLLSSPPLFATQAAEDRSENFEFHIEGDNDDDDYEEEEEEDKEEAPLSAESSKELSPRPPKRNTSIDSFLVPTIQEEQSEDFSVSIDGENIVGEKQ